MIRQNKKLLFIFFILLLTVAAEMIYFLNLKNQKKVLPTTNSIDNNIIPQSTQVTNQNPALMPSIYTYLSRIPKDLLVSSTLTNKYQGKITILDIKEGILSGTFNYKLTLAIGKNNSQIPFYYNDRNLKILKILNKSDDRILGIEDLKIGDEISIEETIDPAKDFTTNRQKILITKL